MSSNVPVELLLAVRQPDTRLLAFDSPFVEYMRNWVIGPTLDATSAALDTLHRIQIMRGGAFLSTTAVEGLYSLLTQCLKRTTEGGTGFAVEPHGEASVYGTICAMSILKSLASPEDRDADLPTDLSAQMHQHLDLDVHAVGRFISQHWTEKSGLFRDRIASRTGSLSSTYSAIRVLMNLGLDRSHLSKLVGEGLERRVAWALERRLKERPVFELLPELDTESAYIGGYCDVDEMDEPSICATYYGLRVAQFFNIGLPEPTGVFSFLRSCYD